MFLTSTHTPSSLSPTAPSEQLEATMEGQAATVGARDGQQHLSSDRSGVSVPLSYWTPGWRGRGFSSWEGSHCCSWESRRQARTHFCTNFAFYVIFRLIRAWTSHLLHLSEPGSHEYHLCPKNVFNNLAFRYFHPLLVLTGELHSSLTDLFLALFVQCCTHFLLVSVIHWTRLQLLQDSASKADL